MKSIKNKKSGYILILIAAVTSIILLFIQDPIAQELKYHDFHDTRQILGILNFWNVMSNLPFFLVGVYGLYRLSIVGGLEVNEEIKSSYMWFFTGISLIAFGSGYYHLWPNNQTLVWDRLPMTIAFMALFSIIISEFISVKVGKKLLYVLILLGVSSVVIWSYGESRGAGDLRYYAFVQFFPMIAIPIIIIFFKSSCSKVGGYWWLFATYVAAKFFEYFDGGIYDISGIISGHSIKHMVAALGTYLLLLSYQRRQCTN